MQEAEGLTDGVEERHTVGDGQPPPAPSQDERGLEKPSVYGKTTQIQRGIFEWSRVESDWRQPRRRGKIKTKKDFTPPSPTPPHYYPLTDLESASKTQGVFALCIAWVLPKQYTGTTGTLCFMAMRINPFLDCKNAYSSRGKQPSFGYPQNISAIPPGQILTEQPSLMALLTSLGPASTPPAKPISWPKPCFGERGRSGMGEGQRGGGCVCWERWRSAYVMQGEE